MWIFCWWRQTGEQTETTCLVHWWQVMVSCWLWGYYFMCSGTRCICNWSHSAFIIFFTLWFITVVPIYGWHDRPCSYRCVKRNYHDANIFSMKSALIWGKKGGKNGSNSLQTLEIIIQYFFNHILCFAFPSSSFPRHTSWTQSVSSARRAPSLYLPSSFSSAPGCLARSFFVLSHFHTVPSAAWTIFEMPLLFEVLEKREWEGTRPRRIAVPSALMQALSICCRELRCMPRRCRARRT